MNKDIHNIANNYFTLLAEAKKPTGKTLPDKQLDHFAVNPFEAANYAKDVLRTEWDKAPGVPKDKAQKIVDAIAKDPKAAKLYAINVLKRRWPEAEHIIATDGMAAADYVLNWDVNIDEWVGKRWVDLENIDPEVAKQAEYEIITGADDFMLPGYIGIFKNRWVDFENIAFTDRKNEIMGMNPEEIKQYYINHLNKLGYEDED